MFLFILFLGCQLQVQNLGATSDRSSYILSSKENEDDNAITKEIFQQEIMNMKNSENSRSSSASREGSIGRDGSGGSYDNNINRLRLGSAENKNKTGHLGRSELENYHSGEDISSVKRSISHSNSNSSFHGQVRRSSPEKQNTVTSPTSFQNFLNKLGNLGAERKEKELSPTGKDKSIRDRLNEIKNNLTNNNTKVNLVLLKVYFAANNLFYFQNNVQSPTSPLSKGPLMTRRQYTDPFGSDDEDEPNENRRCSEPATPSIPVSFSAKYCIQFLT